jgi:hypothetical protein
MPKNKKPCVKTPLQIEIEEREYKEYKEKVAKLFNENVEQWSKEGLSQKEMEARIAFILDAELVAEHEKKEKSKKEYEAFCRIMEDDEINAEIREIRDELGEEAKDWTHEQKAERSKQALQWRANRTGRAVTTITGRESTKTYYPESWTEEQKRKFDEEVK